MKKIKILVASVIMSTFITNTVFAASLTNLIAGSIIIGDKAYSINYISNNVKQLNDILNNSSQGSMYYCNGTNITDLFTGNTIQDSDIATKNSKLITYYNSDGTKQEYAYDSTNGVFNLDGTSSTVQANVKVTSLGGSMNFVSITIPKGNVINMKPYTLDPKYFKVYNNNNSDLVKKIGSPDTESGETNDDYVLNLMTTDNTIRLEMLSSDKVVIAVTKPQTLQTGSNTVTFQLDNYFTLPSTTSNTSGTGNGLGNLNNTGIVNASGNWTYYSNLSDGGGIYKTNGTETYKICEDNAKFINVVGDWIYYSNYGDAQKIYKVKTDGTGRRIVCTDQASYVTVSGENIYYSYHSGTGVGNIRKVSKSATNAVGSNVTSDEAEFLVVVGDMIYFINEKEGNGIYAVHTDGTYRTKITSDNAKFITPANNKLYYITETGQLKWISNNGGSSGSITVSNGNTGSNAVMSSMNITDDGKWIYYVDASDGSKIYGAPLVDYLKISGDKYSDDAGASFINLVGDTVYYTKGKAGYIANAPKISSNTTSVGKSVYTYSSTAIAKPKQSLKIVSYDKTATPTKNAIGSNLNNLEEYLPDKITAVFSDNSVHEVLVDWDLNPKQNSKGASVNYTGTVVGYGTKVTLSLSMASEQIPSTSVKAVNNAGLLDDKIYINKDENGNALQPTASLQVGDVIKVYRDAAKSELLGQTTITSSMDSTLLNGTITLRGTKVLTDTDTTVYVTRTSQGVLESAVTAVTTSALTGKPTFDINPTTGVKVTNYGTLQNGYTENDVVEVLPTDQFQQGDIVNVYKKVDSVMTKIGSQAVTYVPSSDPFAKNQYEVVMSLPAGSIEYVDPTDPKADNNIYITRSTQYAESKSIQVPFRKGIALSLGTLIISGTSGNVYLRNTLDTTSGYKYYYYKGSSATIPYLGDAVDSGWTEITNLSNPLPGSIINGDDVYIVQAYNEGGTIRVLKCSHATAQVN